MKKIVSALLALTMILAIAGCGGSSSAAPASSAAHAASGSTAGGPRYDKLTLKLSYATGDTGMDGVTAIKFEELVEEKSGGVVQIDRYPNCQLVGGDMQRHVEMMIAGGAFEMAIISQTSFNVVDNDFYAGGVPFAYKDYEDLYSKMDGEAGAYINTVYEKYGIKRLDTFPNGLQHLANNKREVKTVADMANLKMRAYGDTQMKLQRAFGADPVNMSWSELYSALQTGTVDGNTNGYQTLYSASMQEVQKYVTECGVFCSAYDFLANMNEWNKWNADTQKLIADCAREAALYGRQYMYDQEDICKQAFIDAGCVITVPTDEELQTFKDAAKPVIDEQLALLTPECKKAFGFEG